MNQVHGSAVQIGRFGVLLRGESGSGKSDLTLRLIRRGALLISDDRVDVVARAGKVWAKAPDAIAGKIEVRGLGVIVFEYASESPLHLVIDLVSPFDEAAMIERMPLRETVSIEGVDLPRYMLAPFESSAPDKVEVMLEVVTNRIELLE